MSGLSINAGTVDAAALMRRVAASVFAPRERMTVSEWAERYREMPAKFTDRAGRWSNDATPYLRGPMDAFNAAETREVSFLKPAQVGGTEWLINTLGYIIDQDPGNVLFIYPTEDAARETNADRLLPALRASPAVARHFSPRPHDTKVLALLLTSMNVYFRGTNSETQLDRVPAAIGIIDELDRCNPAINVAEATRARMTTFEQRSKLLKTGTPSDENVGIDMEYKSADDRRRWLVPCPHCGQYHERYGQFGRVRWERDAGSEGGEDGGSLPTTTAGIERVQHGAWFECPDCGGRIEAKHTKWQALHGAWLSEGESLVSTGAIIGEAGTSPDGPKLSRLTFDELRGLGSAASRLTLERLGVRVENPRERPGRHVGFRLSGLDSTLVANPFGFVALGFVVARGQPDREWVTRKLGEAWRAKGDRVDAHAMRSLAVKVTDGGYRMGTVPMEASILVAGIDVQRDRVYGVVRAFGPHMRDTWLVRPFEIVAPEGNLLRELDQIADWTFERAVGGQKLRIVAATADSGDGVRAREVYLWSLRMRARAARGLVAPAAWPCKGVDSEAMVEEVLDVPLRGSKLEEFRDVGLTLLKVNSQRMSDEVMARARGRLPGRDGAALIVEDVTAPGVFALPEDVPEEYLVQLTAVERRLVAGDPRRQGRVKRPHYHWTARPGMTHRDHWHDAERYAHALAIHIGCRTLSRLVGLVGDAAGSVVAAGEAAKQQSGRAAKRRGGVGGGVGGNVGGLQSPPRGLVPRRPPVE